MNFCKWLLNRSNKVNFYYLICDLFLFLADLFIWQTHDIFGFVISNPFLQYWSTLDWGFFWFPDACQMSYSWLKDSFETLIFWISFLILTKMSASLAKSGPMTEGTLNELVPNSRFVFRFQIQTSQPNLIKRITVTFGSDIDKTQLLNQVSVVWSP